jgi:hypothetical protein
MRSCHRRGSNDPIMPQLEQVNCSTRLENGVVIRLELRHGSPFGLETLPSVVRVPEPPLAGIGRAKPRVRRQAIGANRRFLNFLVAARPS